MASRNDIQCVLLDEISMIMLEFGIDILNQHISSSDKFGNNHCPKIKYLRFIPSRLSIDNFMNVNRPNGSTHLVLFIVKLLLLYH